MEFTMKVMSIFFVKTKQFTSIIYYITSKSYKKKNRILGPDHVSPPPPSTALYTLLFPLSRM